MRGDMKKYATESGQLQQRELASKIFFCDELLAGNESNLRRARWGG